MNGVRIVPGRVEAGSAARAAESANAAGRISRSVMPVVQAGSTAYTGEDTVEMLQPARISLAPRKGKVFLSRAEYSALEEQKALAINDLQIEPLIAHISPSAPRAEEQSASKTSAISGYSVVDRLKKFLGVPF